MKKLYLSFLMIAIAITCPVLKTFAQPAAAFSASPLTGCAPLVVNFTDNSDGSPTAWDWDLGNGTLSALKNPSTTYINPGTYTVTLTVTNATGTGTITRTSFITVYDKPSVNFTVDDSASCIPFVSAFTDLSSTTYGSITAWEWDFDDGSRSNEQNPAHSFTETGNYNVSLKATNDAGCFNIVNKLAYIKAADPLTVSFGFSQPALCKPPETITFTNNSQGPGPVNYLWNFGDGNSSTANNPSHTYNSSGIFSVTLTATNNIGCTGSLQLRDTLVIKNNQTVIESIDTVCINKIMTLTNASTPAPLAARWLFDEESSAFGNTVSITWPSAGNHTVKLISNYGSCTDSVVKTITVLEPPVADFTSTDSFFCLAPALVNFRDVSSGALYWNWDFGDGDSSASKDPAHTYSTEGEYAVRLTVTNAPGCTNTATKYRYIRIAAPAISFDTREGGGCIPYTFRPYPAISSLDSIVSYLWDFGNGNTSGDKFPSHIYSDTGVYTVKLFITTASGCRDSVIIDSAVQTGTPPVVDFNFSQTQACPRTAINFTSLAPAATRWLWKFGDGNSSEEQNPSYPYLDSGLYSVQLIAWNKGCADSVTKNNIISVLPGLARFRPMVNCSNKREVFFKDSSVSAENWRWDFGDGTISTAQNPTHLFGNYQSYTVSLTTSSAQCTNTDSIIVAISNDSADFTVNKNTGCRNEIFSFNNTIADKTNIANYYWDFGDGITDSSSTSDTVRHSYQNGGLYTISLTVEDINGCVSTKTQTGLLFISAPNAAFSLSTAGGCSNQPVQFTDSSTGNISDWYWDFGDGNTRTFTSAPTNITHTYNSTGQYLPILVVVDSANCSDSSMISFPVTISQPVADFTAANFITCPNDDVKFQNISVGENLTYSWNFGDSSSSNAETPVKQYTGDGDYTATLIVTDAFGCTDTVIKQNYIQVKTVTAAFSTIDTNGLCIPYRSIFANTSVNANRYAWDFGDGGFSTTANPNYYYSTAGTFFAKLSAFRSATCLSTDSVRIRINAPSGVLSYLPQNGCAPLQVSFNVVTNDKVSYIWDFNDGTSYTSNNAAVNYTYEIPGNFVPRVVLKDSLGCAVPLFSEDTIRLYSTIVNFKAADPVVCNGEPVQFMDSSFSESPVLSRRWYFGDGSFSTDVNPVHQYATAGNYTVKLVVTTRYGCQDSMVRNSYIRVYRKPAVSISGNDAAYCGAATINFTGNQLNTDNGPVIWKWNFGNGNVSSEKNPPAQQFNNPGSFVVQLTASYNEGCADTAISTVTIKPLPDVFAGNDTMLCAGTSLQLSASGADLYTWQSAAALSCTICSNPVINTIDDVYAYVTASNSEGCIKTDSVFISVKKALTLSVPANVSICSGKSIQLSMEGAEIYTWSPAEGLSNPAINNPVASPSASIIYKVVASDSLNCFTDSALITVSVYQQPYVNLGDDITLNSANPVTLAPVYSGDISSYRWTPSADLSCFDCPNPVASPKKNSTYKVEVTNAGGCTASDEINLFVKCDNSSVSLPTAFSPNNDGRNDKFGPLGSGIVMVSSFRIFNRYGQLIFINGNFRLDDKSGGWDGKCKGQDQPAGNYVYSIEFVCGNNEVSVVNGSVMLVR